MRELTLKDIAGYLPYGLMVQELHNGKIGFVNDLYQLHPNYINDDIKISYDHSDGNHIWMIKPILRPLSDLNKINRLRGWAFVPTEWINDNCIFEIDKDLDFITQNWSQTINLTEVHEIIEKLYEWHFDIHGLIESGLAIDLNTITDQP